MSSLHADQRAMGGGSAITTVNSTADEKQEQGKAAGYVLRTGLREGPGFQ